MKRIILTARLKCLKVVLRISSVILYVCFSVCLYFDILFSVCVSEHSCVDVTWVAGVLGLLFWLCFSMFVCLFSQYHKPHELKVLSSVWSPVVYFSACVCMLQYHKPHCPLSASLVVFQCVLCLCICAFVLHCHNHTSWRCPPLCASLVFPCVCVCFSMCVCFM